MKPMKPVGPLEEVSDEPKISAPKTSNSAAVEVAFDPLTPTRGGVASEREEEEGAAEVGRGGAGVVGFRDTKSLFLLWGKRGRKDGEGDRGGTGGKTKEER